MYLAAANRLPNLLTRGIRVADRMWNLRKLVLVISWLCLEFAHAVEILIRQIVRMTFSNDTLPVLHNWENYLIAANVNELQSSLSMKLFS